MGKAIEKLKIINNILTKQISICKPLLKSFKKLDKKITTKELFNYARLRKYLVSTQKELKSELS